MSYAVKEIFYTLQGEGARAGRAAVFLRFAGCNLWNGVEADRGEAKCTFCDTDFIGTDGTKGGKYPDPQSLAEAVAGEWPKDSFAQPYVVCTGGEPLLQLDEALIAALHIHDFEIAIETNGTILPPPGIEWVCVSPKAGNELAVDAGQELKLVYPQDGAPPEKFADLLFDNYFLQPKDGPDREANTRAAVEYCLKHPQWRLSLQTHKYIGIR